MQDENKKPVDQNEADKNNLETENENTENIENSAENSIEIEKLKEEIAAFQDKHIRLVAEFENYKRRTANEKIELIKTASKDVIMSLLPVLDDLDRAIKNINDSTDIVAVKEGVNLIQSKLFNTLSSKGLKPIETKEKDFDVDFHEAITKVPMEDKKGKVIEEVTKGYMLHDKIIRYAQVVVGE